MAEPFAVIFDFDGVIVDSETAEYKAHRQLFVTHGGDLTVAQWCDTIGICDDPRRWFDALCRLAPSLDFETYEREKRRLFREVVKMQTLDGIDPLLAELDRAGVATAIASNASRRWVAGAAREMGVHDRFAAIVTADDVEHPKPAPDVYLEAARRLGAPPERSVAIEDSENGIRAGKAAGMRVVAIPNPHFPPAEEALALADVTLGSLAELRPSTLA